MINNELRERILATYCPWVYGYKRIARLFGLTRDQVRQVILTATKQRLRNQMASFNPNDSRVKKAKSVYEDRDLSEYSTDAEKIAYLQDENRLLRALLVEYQKEFIPEALSEYPLFQSRDESFSSDEAADSPVKVKKPKRSLKKSPNTAKKHKTTLLRCIESLQISRQT